MFAYKIDKVKPKTETFTSSKELNPEIVETAGFIPLEVKFKQFEQNGLQAQFSTSEFSSQDYRDMYLGPNTEILPTDDLEEIQEKLLLQEEVRKSILKSKLSDSDVERSDKEESLSLNVDKKEVKIGEELVK